MRIAFITREYPPETAWGGIGSFYKELATEVARAGHDVEVFAQGIHRSHTEEQDGVVVHRVIARTDVIGEAHPGDLAGCTDIGDFAYALAQQFLEVFLQRHRENPFNIVEGHEHLGVNALINLYGPKDVITVTRYHTSYHALVHRGLVDWPKSPRISRLETTSVVQAQHRITTSRFINQVVNDDFALDYDATLLANFSAPPPVIEKTPAAREKLIIFAGRMVRHHKRPDLAAQAFARMAAEFPEWHIEFAGPDMELPEGGTTWGKCADILSSIDPARFCYRGILSAVEMHALYQRASIIVVPSRFESFGMVAIEAMQRGCVPVVATQTALTDATADPALEFNNGDLEELCNRLGALMVDADFLQQKSEQCRRRVLSAFDHDRLVQQNLGFFASIRHQPVTIPPNRTIDSKRPKISIITPSYNQGPYIEETILSILNQDYPEFEHVVMDGGSTDSTTEVLRRYPHLIWRSEKDRGQSHAINKGLLQSQGEIFAYLNSDDVYRAGTFHTVAGYFLSHPEADVVVGHCDVINESSEVTGHYQAKAGAVAELIQYWEWDRLHCIPQQSVFFRRSVLSEIGLFDESHHMTMDYEFWLRLTQSGRTFHVIDKTLAAFRIIPTTKTGGRTDEMYLEEYLASSRYRKHLPLGERFEPWLKARRHVSHRLLDLSEHLVLSTPSGKKPLKLLGKALSFNPFIVLHLRFWLSLAGGTSKGTLPVTDHITKLHRRHLERLWHKSQKTSS